MRVGIIGAGPAGLTAALTLARRGEQVVVFEAGLHVGGLSRSIDLFGQRVDIGPHRFFSTDSRVNRFWLGVVGDQYEMVDRLTRVYFQGQLVAYPIRPLSAMRQLGLVEAARCLSSYLVQKTRALQRTEDSGSFESWVTSRFGHRLFEVFFRTYSEKLWGIPCSELSADFAAQRIRQFSLWEALASAVLPNHAKQHKTLVDRFAYPRGGTGAVYDAMADEITQLGGHIHRNCPIVEVGYTGSQVTGLRPANAEMIEFDHVVSTMPLTRLVAGLRPDEPTSNPVPDTVHAAAAKLTFRNTLLVYLNIDSESLFDDQWLYIQSPRVRAGRVTNFRNWTSPSRRDHRTSILAVEQWCDDDDEEWTADDATLVARASDELKQIGLLHSETILGGHVMRIRRSYPVYRCGYEKHVRCLAEYLSRLSGLTCIGRYGAFKYNNQDHSILMGLLAAENILDSAGHNLWGINSDFDAYQEQSLITETGLVPVDSAPH